MTVMEEDGAITNGGDCVSLCLLLVGEEVFGIDTHAIREVLGPCLPRPVPLVADYMGGILSYRGDVLTTLSLRVLLGMGEEPGPSHVVVLDDRESGEQFGLLVDAVPGVLEVNPNTVVACPTMLEERSAFLVQGLVRRPEGVVIQLAAERLSPTSLSASAIFGRAVAPLRFLPIKVNTDSQRTGTNDNQRYGRFVGDVA